VKKQMFNRRLYFVLFLGTIVVFPTIAQIPILHYLEAGPENVLDFLRDVCLLDVSKYNMSLTGPTTDHPERLGGLVEMVGYYNFVSENSRIEVGFSLINNTLTWCNWHVRQGEPILIQSAPASDVLAAIGFLERFQAFNNDSTLQPMISTVNTLDVSKNNTSVSGNLKTAVILSSSTQFVWQNVYNGAAFSGLGLVFEKGVFRSFSDDRSYIEIGGTNVTVSRERAIDMAVANAASFSYSYGGQQFSNLNFSASRVNAALLTKGRDRPLVLYPYWQVGLPLGKAYPGFVTMLVVEFWADTGELIRIYPLGTGGGFDSEDPTPAPSVSPQPSPTTDATPSISASASTSPESTASPVTSESPLSTTSSPPQLTASPSLASADNSGDQKSVNSTLLIVLAGVFVVVAVAGSIVLVLRRRRRLG
jgi:hypothetical protein